MTSTRYLGGLLVLAAIGCSSTQSYELAGGSVAPGADAVLEVSPGKQGNRHLALSVQNLLPPDRVIDGGLVYAVWLQRAGQQPIHLGNLEYDAKDRTGTFEAVTPYESFLLSVRAEASLRPNAPGSIAVLSREVTMRDDD